MSNHGQLRFTVWDYDGTIYPRGYPREKIERELFLQISDLVSRICRMREETTPPAEGIAFQNNIFAIRPYAEICECACDADDWDEWDVDHDCPSEAPNFSCGGFWVRWYRPAIGGYMIWDPLLSFDQITAILQRCRESLR